MENLNINLFQSTTASGQTISISDTEDSLEKESDSDISSTSNNLRNTSFDYLKNSVQENPKYKSNTNNIQKLLEAAKSNKIPAQNFEEIIEVDVEESPRNIQEKADHVKTAVDNLRNIINNAKTKSSKQKDKTSNTQNNSFLINDTEECSKDSQNVVTHADIQDKVNKMAINVIFNKCTVLVEKKIARDVRKKLQEISEGFTCDNKKSQDKTEEMINKLNGIDCDIHTAVKVYQVLLKLLSDDKSNEVDLTNDNNIEEIDLTNEDKLPDNTGQSTVTRNNSNNQVLQSNQIHKNTKISSETNSTQVKTNKQKKIIPKPVNTPKGQIIEEIPNYLPVQNLTASQIPSVQYCPQTQNASSQVIFPTFNYLPTQINVGSNIALPPMTYLPNMLNVAGSAQQSSNFTPFVNFTPITIPYMNQHNIDKNISSSNDIRSILPNDIEKTTINNSINNQFLKETQIRNNTIVAKANTSNKITSRITEINTQNDQNTIPINVNPSQRQIVSEIPNYSLIQNSKVPNIYPAQYCPRMPPAIVTQPVIMPISPLIYPTASVNFGTTNLATSSIDYTPFNTPSTTTVSSMPIISSAFSNVPLTSTNIETFETLNNDIDANPIVIYENDNNGMIIEKIIPNTKQEMSEARRYSSSSSPKTISNHLNEMLKQNEVKKKTIIDTVDPENLLIATDERVISPILEKPKRRRKKVVTSATLKQKERTLKPKIRNENLRNALIEKIQRENPFLKVKLKRININ